MYKIVYTKSALKYANNLKSSGLAPKMKLLVNLIQDNPYQNPPPYEKLGNNLKGLYSRRINIKHRLVYEVIEGEKTIKILSMWTHYEF